MIQEDRVSTLFLKSGRGGVKPNSLIEIYAYAVNYNTHCFELHLLRTNLGFRKA